ncbi:hypothetical protein CEUSTIGMA_g4207.t1 [Chlamydomonas eustigma]|uniref:J domain-containing protein n=1 Tax=Chlamydomonas eustigma TaxID=1157962 RepID=A0A250X1Z0_9CHLO|nr:hypothetical protein CEUSTIGMA_g4207.t1 [Chlamydomonas eustigma]|eukprot:GAX76760.1 hypothetical protein CEUSTIGMA_g4207.t1 [Chlamydomonas eustigma]
MTSATTGLYEVLGIESFATQEQVKKAYFKLALRLHPDKNPGDEEAHAKFQSLQEVYKVLGDPDRRKLYDETGIVSEDALGGASFDDLKAYYGNIFKRVTEEDLNSFMDSYRGSDEEKSDVLKHYQQFRGNMGKVFEYVMCSDEDMDAHRFMDIVQLAAQDGEVKLSKAFKVWAVKVAARRRPEDPLRKRSLQSLGPRGVTSTSQVLVLPKRDQSAFFNSLEVKYGKGKKRGSEPTEEEFQALQDRMFSNNKGTEKENRSEGTSDVVSKSSKKETTHGHKDVKGHDAQGVKKGRGG